MKLGSVDFANEHFFSKQGDGFFDGAEGGASVDLSARHDDDDDEKEVELVRRMRGGGGELIEE